jgi:hypothetical protein
MTNEKFTPEGETWKISTITIGETVNLSRNNDGAISIIRVDEDGETIARAALGEGGGK